MTTAVYTALAVVGLVLIAWTLCLLPEAATASPDDERTRTETRGPYRLLRHPLYAGEWLFITGAAGLAGGFWNAVALGFLAQLVLGEWILREDRVPPGPKETR